MFWQKLPDRIAALIVVITIPLVLLLVNLYLLASPVFVNAEYARPGFPDAPGFTDSERLHFAEASLTYLRSSQGVDAIERLQHGGEPLYNWRELLHLADVKVVMYWAFLVFWVAFLLLLIAVIYILSSPTAAGRLPVYIFRGCLVIAAAMAAIAGAALFNFNGFFVFFHRVFFQGDSWLFSATDSLIRLFPLPFWIDAAAMWIMLVAAETIVVGAAAYLWPGWKHRR